MPKKLYRDLDNKWLAGVLAGLASYINIDVVVVRLLFIFILLVTGFMPALIAYIVAWVVIPVKPLIEPVPKADYTVST